MQKNLIEDLGENYEYIRVIITNKLKLKQIQAMETGSSIAALLILLLVMLVIVSTILVGLFALGTLILMQSVSSITAVACMLGVYTVIAILIILARKPLIVSPILRALHEAIPID